MVERKTLTPQHAADMAARARAAPILPIGPEEETRYSVARVALLAPDRMPFLETTEGKFFRLPDGLTPWAHDLVVLSLHSGQNPFPAPVRFGVIDGRIWAEID